MGGVWPADVSHRFWGTEPHEGCLQHQDLGTCLLVFFELWRVPGADYLASHVLDGVPRLRRHHGGPAHRHVRRGHLPHPGFLGWPARGSLFPEKVLLSAFPVVGSGALLIVCTKAAIFHIVAEIIMALSMGTCAACIFKLVPIYVPEALGGAAGLVGGLGAFGSFVLPPLMASFVSMMNKEGYPMGFCVYVALASAGWVIVLLLKLFKRRAEEYEDTSEDSSFDSDSDEESE